MKSIWLLLLLFCVPASGQETSLEPRSFDVNRLAGVYRFDHCEGSSPYPDQTQLKLTVPNKRKVVMTVSDGPSDDFLSINQGAQITYIPNPYPSGGKIWAKNTAVAFTIADGVYQQVDQDTRPYFPDGFLYVRYSYLQLTPTGIKVTAGWTDDHPSHPSSGETVCAFTR